MAQKIEFRVEHLNSLQRQMAKLSKSQRIAFGASCCERAYPNYQGFVSLTKWGNPRILRTSIDVAWMIAEGGSAGNDDINLLKNQCESVTPDLDDFSTADVDVQAAAAQEAAFMVTLLLESCVDDSPGYPWRIARFALDTLDMFVQVRAGLDPSDPELDRKIAQSDLMAKEIDAQTQDVRLLLEAASPLQIQGFHRRSVSRSKSI